ncbi:hypothetical protein AMS68_004179 [Peltaster fructicola]|uniref:FAD dependent oxidoreductase domain-containing protein n=1 Tax=Peltaster fructicola TaxID=286661 RepID=A0A6H0XV76_9PEZI|nr:hypothetical protein AMS68_004179 [Peltaster fructicola]
MSFPDVRHVAVIGAGISGVCSAAHLLEQNIHVTVLERSSIAGGVWHFDEHAAPDSSYPNEVPSVGDFEKASTELFETGYLTPPRTPDTSAGETDKDWRMSARTTFAPPGACYEKLNNNVPLTLMKNSLADWPEGVPEFVNQRILEEYVQRIAHEHGVHERTQYGVRVENVRKLGKSWEVRTTYRQQDNSASFRLLPRTQLFDAVVVATGHYHNPRIPDFPGLAEWKQRYPDRISHSKQYRRAAPFKSETILLVGAGTSSTDIAKELSGVAKHVFQTSRGGPFDHPASVLPANTTRVGNVQAFELTGTHELHSDEALPGSILLHNGQRLCGINRIILCTGYVTSYPFLPQYHDDHRSADDADEHVLVTKDGDMVHNLHKDIFYIEEPTLAFIGKPYHTANFSLFDFQAQLMARVFAKLTSFPSKSELRAEYNERVRLKGRGRDFHSLRQTGAEPAYVNSLVEWANRDIVKESSTVSMRGHTQEWLSKYAEFRETIEKRIGLRLAEAKAVANKFDHVVITGPNAC